MKIATVAIGLLVGVVLHSTPAVADLPANVHRGTTGVMTAEWGQIQCASSGDGLRCVIRVPGRFSRFDVTAKQGRAYADMKTWAFPRVERVYAKPRRARSDEVVPGVQVSCESRGNRHGCTIALDGRFDHVKVQVFSAGVSQGTMDGYLA